MNIIVLLSSLGLIALLAEIFNFKKLLYPFTVLGLAVTFFIGLFASDKNGLFFFDLVNVEAFFLNMVKMDNFAVGFSSVILLTGLLWFIFFGKYVNDKENNTNYHALVTFAMVGAVLMTCYINLAMLFLGIEILSIPMYVLAGSKRDNLLSNEAAFKYLIMGAFSTGFLLFGIALIYGATGSFDLSEIAISLKLYEGEMSGIFYIGLLMILVAMLFKISAVPFHFWAPDVYQGAPTPVTAFMATIVKAAAFAAFMKLFHTVFAGEEVSGYWTKVIPWVATLTLLVGNITAVMQNNVKRMLAYSSIAHAGYMLLALVALNEYSQGSVLYYTLVYSIGSIASFTVIRILSEHNDGDYETESFNGLAKRNPLLAGIMTVALLSLAGIPPTAGFFAKYYIFVSAFYSGYIGLVIVAILASLIGVYYYFRIIIAMYFKEATAPPLSIKDYNYRFILVLLAAAIVVLGLFPDIVFLRQI